MNKMEFTINTANLDYVNSLVDRFNKKAVKLGKKGLVVSYSEPVFDDSDIADVKQLINLTITQFEEFKIGDYSLAAKIDHTYPGKNFVKPYENITDDQEKKFQSLKPFCDHCNSKRKRNITFILKNLETGEFVQVGKSCLKDFTGHDIKSILNYFDLLEDLENNIVDSMGNDKKIIFYEVNTILNLIIKEIEKNGYRSNKAKEEGKTLYSTADMVKSKLSVVDLLQKLTDAEIQKIEMVKNYIISYDYTDEKEYLQDFYRNLRNIIKYKYCKFDDINILSSLFMTYNILKEKEQAKKEKGFSEYIGKIGDKIEIEVRLKNIYSYDSEYGTMFIYTFADKKGNIYKWSTKNNINIENENYSKIKGTIKKHNEYKGEKQTVITRCKIL